MEERVPTNESNVVIQEDIVRFSLNLGRIDRFCRKELV